MISGLLAGILEEFGWIGFAFPRLQKIYGFVPAGLAMGFIVAFWHIPLFFTPGQPQERFVPFLLTLIVVRFLFGWVYNGSGGSILLLILSTHPRTSGPRSSRSARPLSIEPGWGDPRLRSRRCDRGLHVPWVCTPKGGVIALPIEELQLMRADVSFSPSPALWVILAVVVVGTLAGWFWVRRSRASRGVSARPAVFSLIGDVTENALPAGRSDEQIVVVIGDVRMDLRDRAPSDGAILRVFHLIGDVRLRVSPGARVVTSGSTLLGDQRVVVAPGEGPELEVAHGDSSGTLRSATNGEGSVGQPFTGQRASV